MDRIYLRKKALKFISREWQFFILLAPTIAFFILFHYMPMYGLIMSFKDLKVGLTIAEAPWVGFRWFEEFMSSTYFWRSFKNTLILSGYSIIFFFPLPIVFALILNEIKNNSFKRITQTISYFPYFISTVVVVGLMMKFLSPETGIINQILEESGKGTINFFQKREWFRPLYILSDIWQGLGWNAIIFIAALSSINPETYEAAKIDGASRIKQIRHVSIPGILPTIMILLVLRIGSILTLGYEKVLLMYNPATYSVADIVSTYVYRTGIIQGRLGYATAVGFFNAIVNVLVLVTFNRISKKISSVGLW